MLSPIINIRLLTSVLVSDDLTLSFFDVSSRHRIFFLFIIIVIVYIIIIIIIITCYYCLYCYYHLYYF